MYSNPEARKRTRVRRRRPASQGHPSQGRPTVGGGTRSHPKVHVYRTPPAPSKPTAGHPSRGGRTVSGGTKRHPKVGTYHTKTPSIKVQRKRQRKLERATRRNARRSKLFGDLINEPARELSGQSRPQWEHSLRAIDERRKREAEERSRERQGAIGGAAGQRHAYRRGVTGQKVAGSPINLGKVAKPAAEVLDQFTRVGDATVAAMNQKLKTFKKLAKGKKVSAEELNVAPGRAAWKAGVTREKVVRGSELLRTAGIKNKAIQRWGGLATEIGLDPLNAVPVTGVVKLGRANRIRAAARTAADTAGPRRGASVAVRRGGQRVVTGGKTPAERKAFRRARSQAARREYTRRAAKRPTVEVLGRDRASKVVGGVRPHHLTEDEHRRLIIADRQRRGIELSESRRSARKSRAVRHKAKGERGTRRKLFRRPIPTERSLDVRRELEANQLESTAAKKFRSETERQLTRERESAIRAGEKPPERYRPEKPDEPAGYAPRIMAREVEDRKLRKRLEKAGERELEEAGGSRARFGGRVRTRSPLSPRRTIRDEFEQVGEGKFIADLETSLIAKGQKSARFQGTTHFRNEVKKLGKPYKPGDLPPPGWGVYMVKDEQQARRFVELTDAKAQATHGDEAMLLPRAVAQEANKSLETTGHIAVLDPATNAAKLILTVPNPQYWIRNAYGGLFNAWVEGMPAYSMLPNIVRAMQVNRRVSKAYRAEELGRSATAGLLARGHGTRIVEGGAAVRRAKPEEFAEALGRSDAPPGYLTPYSTEELGKLDTYLHPSGEAGFALRGDEIVNLFRTAKAPKGTGEEMLRAAERRGGRRLDATSEPGRGLEKYYSERGYRTTKEEPWDPAYGKPPTPESRVVYMEKHGGKVQRGVTKEDDELAKLTETGGKGDIVMKGLQRRAETASPRELQRMVSQAQRQTERWVEAAKKVDANASDEAFDQALSIAASAQVAHNRQRLFELVQAKRAGRINELGQRVAANNPYRYATEYAPYVPPTAPREIRVLAEKKIKLGSQSQIGPDITVRELIGLMERENVIGGGQTVELLGAATAPRHFAQGAEELPRTTAFLHFLRKGLSPEDASWRVQRSQFDYGLISGFEKKVARRIWPFYTWRSRNIALQAETAVLRPGKFANVERVRDTLVEDAGLPKDWESRLAQGEVLQLPVPIPGWKQDGHQKLAFTALPITDLNLVFPLNNPGIWFDSMLQMANPVVKNPIEFATGYSFYWKDRLEQDYNRWTPAPAHAVELIDSFAPGIRKAFENAGIIAYDPEQKTWMWRGRVDYLSQTFPLSSLATTALTAGTTARGSKAVDRVIGWSTGVRPGTYRPGFNTLQRLYDKRDELETKAEDLSELNQDKGPGGRYTKENAELKTQLNRVEWRIHDLAKRIGESGAVPQTSRGKTYRRGYDPELRRNPGETEQKSSGRAIWETAPSTPKQRRSQRKREKAIWE